jgi:hypothetical protein
MAAILKLRRGTTIPSLVQSELFYNTSNDILLVGDGSSQISIVKIGSNTGSIEFTGAVTASSISSSGDVIANNISASNLDLTGNAVIDGNITLGGNIYLGDQIADNINVTAQFSGSLIPSASNEYDLGSSVKKWRNLWVVSASIDDLTVGGSGILSSSNENFTTFSSSVDSRLDNTETTGSDHESRIDILETTFSSSVDSRLDNAETTGSDHESRLDTIETTFSSSVDSRLDLLEITGSDHESRIDEIETTFSSSVDYRLDTLEGPFSTSVDSRLDNTEITGSDHESRLDTIETTFSSSVDFRLDNTELTGSDHESRIDILETTFSSSVDTRLDTLEGPFSTSVDSRLDDLETFSQSLDAEFLNTNGDGVVSGSDQVTQSLDLRYLEINGDNVFTQSSQVNANDITNFDSNVKDKMNTDTVVSGSSQILDGSGILSSSNENFTTFSSSIDGRVDILETTFSSSVDSRLDELEGNFSSSVDSQLNGLYTYTSSLKNSIEVSGANLTVLGNLTVQGTQTSLNTNDLIVEDKLIAIASGSTSSATSDGAGLFISGANASITWNHSDTVLEFNTKVSSSIGFKGDGSELIDIQHGNVDFGGSDIISGSSQVTQSLDTRYLEINGDSVVSSSQQISNYNTFLEINGDSVVSSSQQISNYNVFAELNGDNLVSSSQQISDYNTFLEINSDSVVSSSQQISNYGIFAELNGDNLVSSSQQISNYGIFAELNGDNLVSSSQQVIGHLPSGIISGSTYTNFSSSVDSRLDTLEGSFSTSVDLRLDNVESTGSDHESRLDTLETTFSSSVDSRLDYVETTFSSSVDGRLDLLENFSSSEYITDSSSFDGRLDNIETFTSSIDGRVSSVEGTSHTHSNKANLDTINQNLSTTSNVTFDKINISSVSLGDSTNLNALLISSSDEVIYRGLGSAAFVHYSQSIDDGNPAVIGTAGAVKSYVDAKIISAGAGDITAVTPHPGGGLFGGGFVGHVSLSLDTGSSHFTEGVHTKIDNLRLISGSSQLTSSFVQTTGDETIGGNKTFSGNLIIQGDLSALGQLTYISSSVVTIEDNFIRVNYGGSRVDGGIQVTDTFGVNTITGSLAYDANLDYWKAGKSGLESRIILESDGVVSQSVQINVQETTNYSAINQYSDTKVETFVSNRDFHSGSYLGIATTSDLDEGLNKYYTDSRVLNYINSISVLSGSVDLSTLVTTSSFHSYTQSNDSRVSALENWSSSLDSSYVTEGELTTLSQSIDNTISTKLNTGSYNTDSQSFDSRIDTLEGASNENPLTFSDTTTITLNRVGDDITADAIGGIISSSIQIDNLGFLQVNGDNVVSSSAQVISLLPNGVISGSSQITGGSGLVSSSQQVINHLPGGVISGSGQVTSSLDSRYVNEIDFTPFSQSVDSRIDTLEGVSNENPLTFNDTSTIDLVRTGDIITATAIGGIVSSSEQVKNLGFVDLSSDQTISGTKTFNDIVVNGTGSFAYIESVSGTAKIIGDAFIVLNNDTPTERYAGIAVYDSGSANTTASFQFDGQTNDWFYEYNDGAIDYGVVLFGPEYSTKGSPTYPSNNKVLKGTGGHHLADSNITDNGTTINLGSNTTVSGTLVSTGTTIVSQSLLNDLTDSEVNQLKNIGTSTISATQWGYLGSSDQGIASGDDPTFNTLTLDVADGTAPMTVTSTTKVTNLNADLLDGLTSDNFLRSNATDTASGVITFSNTTNSTSKTTGAVIVSGGVGIAKTLNVGEDIVAYASSDRRLKDEIIPISNPLDKINQIGGYSFVWNSEKQNIYKGKDYGVIAQEIEEILPELVDTRENGYKAVKYDKLVSLLIEGIKELSSEIKELKEKIK